ncbi:hypothetical protein GQ53DRAFT_827381 [Thozetella sp. PMI_491]|nr:hypothetical protein GQ53DRAFT_827381 [Thozetella sp. PMI_491]
MVTDHEAVAIAETVLYVPILPVAMYVIRRNWNTGRPRMAWTPLAGFSSIRIAGGVVVILLQSNPDSLGLIIAALVLLNVGVVPLIISTLGLIRTIIADSFEAPPRLARLLKGLRIAIFIAIALLATGGGLGANDNTVNTGHSLTRGGYIVFAAVLVTMVVLLFRLGLNPPYPLAPGTRIYQIGSAAAIPFLALRTIYGLISAFNSDSILSTWNPLFGSAPAFALMALLPEYITLLIYLYLGIHRLRHGRPPIVDSETTSK